MFSRIQSTLSRVALIKQIAVGLIIGVLIAIFAPGAIPAVSILGDLFVKALKGIAPVLVFFLVMNAMAQRKENAEGSMKPIIVLYAVSAFCASLVGVGMSFLFPTSLVLQVAPETKLAPPSGIVQVLHNLILSVVDNPVAAIMNANYIGILAWAIIFGIAMKSCASGTTKTCLNDISEAITKVVTWVIHCAPFGIMGLVFSTLRESGVYAFFTRSSAANIPVNLSLCRRLGLNPDLFTISIPLGATINMAGASITISVLSLAAAHTLGIAIDLPTAFLLCIVSTIGACGTSGVAGGSLLLIPVACASFGIGNDISMQVVGVGFIISVLEDACETALNSSSDVLFTATAEFAERRKEGILRKEDLIPKHDED